MTDRVQRQQELNKLITSVFRRHPGLSYFQVGCSLFLVTLLIIRASPFSLTRCANTCSYTGIPRHYHRPLPYPTISPPASLCRKAQLAQVTRLHGKGVRTSDWSSKAHPLVTSHPFRSLLMKCHMNVESYNVSSASQTPNTLPSSNSMSPFLPLQPFSDLDTSQILPSPIPIPLAPPHPFLPRHSHSPPRPTHIRLPPHPTSSRCCLPRCSSTVRRWEEGGGEEVG